MSQPLTPSNATKQIAEHLRRITHQHFFRSFEDWLGLAITAFLRDDDSYMKIIARYGPREAPMGEKDHPADHFARALGTWMLAMKMEPKDYLGRVYEENGAANEYAGQFLTPEDVVELMAQLTMPADIPDNALVSDPACGSGRMLIAGIKRNRFATFIGTDVDLNCVHMTALNCLVRNANTYILHGNSLSLETYGGFYVRRSVFGGELFRLTREQTHELIRLPFKAPAVEESTTALTPSPTAPVVHQASPEVQATIQEVSEAFLVNKKGQVDFGF